MPKNNNKNLHWIIPLLSNTNPYKQFIPNPTHYQGNDELVLSESMLKTFKASRSLYKAKCTFAEVRAEHQRCVKNVSIKYMGEPFGQGAFADGAGLKFGDSLIYSGLYSTSEDIRKLPGKPRYLASLASGLSVNGQCIMGVSRYAQHLPDEEYADLIAAMDEKPAMENVYLMTTYVSIKINKIHYILPVSRLEVMSTISPGSMIGFSYGKDYWNSQEVTPSFFTPHGEPLNKVVLKAFTDESDGILIYLDKTKEQLFLTQRYIHYNFNTLFILPKIVKELSKGRANGVYLPALYRISCKIVPGAFNSLNYFNSCTDDEMIALLVSKKPDQDFLNPTDGLIYLLKDLNCRTEIKELGDDINLICIYIKDIAELEISSAETLFKRLNIESDDTFSKVEFSVLISPTMRKEIESGTGFRSRFFARKTLENNASLTQQYQALKM